jgi:hypothetical protein
MSMIVNQLNPKNIEVVIFAQKLLYIICIEDRLYDSWNRLGSA